jgi:tetratricopeptide (TPR) repeat protein
MKRTVMMVLSFQLGLCPLLAQQEQRPTPPGGGRGSVNVTHSIRGRVFLPNNFPAQAPMRVTLRTFTQGVIQEAFTDSAGNFELRGIPNGNYELVVWGDKEIDTAVERVEVFGSASRTFFQSVFLKEKEKEQPFKPKGGVVPVSELSANIPKSARKEYERGVKQADKKEPEKAIAHFQEAIKLYPSYFQAHNDLGVQYVRLNQFAEAEAAFLKAAELESRAPQPHLNLGHMRILQQQYQEAVTFLTRAIELDSANWEGHMWLGAALMQTKQDELSKIELEKAILLGGAPQASPARLYLANLYIRQADWGRAIEQCELYLKEVPKAENEQQVRQNVARMRSALEAQVKDRRP